MDIVTQDAINAVQEASGHSVYGGSSLPRIVACPGSVLMALRAGLKPESVYAKKGSVLHDWSFKAESNPNPREYILRQKGLSIEDTALLLDSHEYVSMIKEKHTLPYELFLEHNEDLGSWGLPEVYGTADVRIESATRIDVIDYKYGFGVSVGAKDNYQLVAYLAQSVPFSEEGVDKELYVHICQPPKGIFEEWHVTWERLCQMVLGDVTDAIRQSREPNPPYNPGPKQCQFCAGNMICAARRSYLKQQAAQIYAISKDPTQASVEQWATFLDGFEALKNAANNAEAFALNELMAGRDFPGYKLVKKRANRAFKDQEVGEAYIEERLGLQAYAPRKVITLAQAEKLQPELKKDPHWKGLIYTPEGGVKLAKSDDARPALKGGLEMFDSCLLE
jgi:hypothetical protein